jgi:hypothetical protein
MPVFRIYYRFISSVSGRSFRSTAWGVGDVEAVGFGVKGREQQNRHEAGGRPEVELMSHTLITPRRDCIFSCLLVEPVATGA